jgi:hypothetical protein
MRGYVALLTLALASGLFAGCGQPSSDSVAKPDSSHEATEDQAPTVVAATEAFEAESPVLDSSPDSVVSAFLQALRDGDDSLAESLLTKKAREETAKHHLTVQPPGSPSASFTIGKVDFLSEDQRGAHVTCVWTEKNEQGDVLSYEITWALRRQPEGWRLAGMATQIVDSEPAVFLNFEDPDDMLRKWQEAETRLAGTKDSDVR